MIVKCTVLCYYCLRKTLKPNQPEHIFRTGNNSASADRNAFGFITRQKLETMSVSGFFLFGGAWPAALRRARRRAKKRPQTGGQRAQKTAKWLQNRTTVLPCIRPCGGGRDGGEQEAYCMQTQQGKDHKSTRLQRLPLNALHPFPGHPFRVRDDEALRAA